MPTTRRTARQLIHHPQDRRRAIERTLVTRIKTGEWAPATRLPRWRELAAEFDTTLTTIAKVVGRLEECGFIENGGWHGAHVAAQLPHETRYGLVFGDRQSRFYDTLVRSSQTLSAAGPARIVVYRGIGEPAASPDSWRLTADLETGCLAGVIVGDHYTLRHTALQQAMAAAALPMACLGEAATHPLPRVGTDWRSVIARGHEYLAARGCRRVGVLFNLYVGDEHRARVHAAQQAHGLVADDGYLMGMMPGMPHWLGTWVRLLLALPPGLRPDGFIVTDDHLVGDFLAALQAHGLCAGADVPVIAHCNYPCPPADGHPGVTLLGFDSQQVLRTALAALRAPGGAAAAPFYVPAVFAHELQPAPQAALVAT